MPDRLILSLSAARTLTFCADAYQHDVPVRLLSAPGRLSRASSKAGRPAHAQPFSVADLTQLCLAGLLRRVFVGSEPAGCVSITATGLAFLAVAKIDDAGTEWSTRRGTMYAARERAVIPQLQRLGRTFIVGG